MILMIAALFLQNAGYRIVDLKKDDGKTLTVAVWYPTDIDAKDFAYGSGKTRGKVAENAEPRKGSYPLVVYSHGYGGSGLSAAYFSEALAAKGYVVAAPDHVDDYNVSRIRGDESRVNMRDYIAKAKKLGDSKDDFKHEDYAYRRADVKLVIDSMLTHDTFGALIDKEKIGVAGHSLGGYTVSAVSGPKDADARIKACLLFSAKINVWSDKDFETIKVPVMLMQGEDEAADRERKGSGIYDAFKKLRAPKYAMDIKGGNHFSFDNGNSRLKLGGTKDQLDVIARYGVAFFERHLRGDEKAKDVLDPQDARLTKYEHE